MRCVIQRVTQGRVTVGGKTAGEIKTGFVVLVGVAEGDSEQDVSYCAGKIAGLRVFEDEQEKMNLSLSDVGGDVLLVSQFTLLGDARHGRRPSFSDAARPQEAETLFLRLKQALEQAGLRVETGIFRTHMEVSLVNDGPVTILLDSRKGF